MRIQTFSLDQECNTSLERYGPSGLHKYTKCVNTILVDSVLAEIIKVAAFAMNSPSIPSQCQASFNNMYMHRGLQHRPQ